MLVVGISGSPRCNGNSEKIITMAMDYFTSFEMETKAIMLSEVNVSPCVHCNGCKKQNYCVKDPLASEINEILGMASGIIVASPVYFGGMSGQLKCLIDKTRPLKFDNLRLRGKIGAAIATGGGRNGGQESTIRDIHSWMLIQGMMIVGDNQHFGGTVVDSSPASKITAFGGTELDSLDIDENGRDTVVKTFESLKEALFRLS